MAVLTPSDPEYWDEYYTEGEGNGEVFEWYTQYQDVKDLIQPVFAYNDKILHIGSGNSLLAECILADQDFAANLKFTNIDICEIITERVQSRSRALFEFIDSKRSRKAPKPSKDLEEYEKVFQAIFASDRPRYFAPEQLQYLLGDVTKMPQYEDGGFDVVLDKGMIDAVLSHGEVETGENEFVQLVNREVFRVLKDGGHYIVVSGNDGFITMPYFTGDEEVNWKITSKQIAATRKAGGKGKRTLFFYDLVADKAEI